MLPFNKDSFSTSTPSFSKLDRSDQKAISSVVKRLYPNLAIKEVYQVSGFEINSNNWKLECEDATFILKRANTNKLASLTAQAGWTAQLAERSFPTLRFVKDCIGQLISQDQHSVYCVTYFEEGQYFGSSLHEWDELLEYTRKLYDYSLKYDQEDVLNIPSRHFFSTEEIQLVTRLKSTDEIPGISNTQRALITEEFEKLRKDFETRANDMNTGIFHIDIHPHNLIFNEGSFSLLTDFESFQKTTVEISLGFGLYKCLRQLLSLSEFSEGPELRKVVTSLSAQFHVKFPELHFHKLLVLGKIDVLKRILHIINELLEGGHSRWSFVLNTQLTALQEINEIHRVLTLTD